MEQFHSEKIVDIDSCRKEAEELYAEFKDQIESQIDQPVDGVRQMGEPYPNLIEHYLESVPADIQSHFWAHGITRGDKLNKLTALISVLRNNAIVGDSARLRNSGFQDAWTHGSFLIISKKDTNLTLGETFEERRHQRIILGKKSKFSDLDLMAIKVTPGAIAINGEFYPIVEELRRRFPYTNILYAKELPEYLSK